MGQRSAEESKKTSSHRNEQSHTKDRYRPSRHCLPINQVIKYIFINITISGRIFVSQ